MSTFAELSQAFNKIDVKQVLKMVLQDEKIQSTIKDIIKNRIINTGIAGDNTKLRTDRAESGEFYNSFTIFWKEEKSFGKGSITDHVTLYQGGQFWDSLKVEILDNSFKTDADFEKKDGHMFKNFQNQYSSKKDFEDAVTSLTPDELKKVLRNFIEPEFMKLFYASL